MLDGRNDNVADPCLPRAKQAAAEMAFRRDVLVDYASVVHRYDRASVVQGNAMTDDITHNLTVVREALEAEGLGMHVKLIDTAIEDVAKLHAQMDTAADLQKDRNLNLASLEAEIAALKAIKS